jgi:HlyD family secretion protein
MQRVKSGFKTQFLAMLVIALILTGCANTATSRASSSSSAGVVTTITVTDQIETSGNLDADELAKLTWGTSGKVANVKVTVGQAVKAGDILAALDENSVPADITSAHSSLASAQLELDNLLASNADLAAAQQAVATAQQAVSTAQKKVDSLYYPRASDALVQRTQAQIELAKRQVAIATYNYRGLINKADKNPDKAQALYNMTNAQLNLNELISTYNWYTGKATNLDDAEYRAALAVAQADLEDAQREWDRLENGPDAVKVAAAKAKIAAAKELINSMYIIAPFDGEIISVQTSVGSQIEKDSAAVEIVNRNTLKVETLIDETAISAVALGNPAEITMDSLPNTTLTGQVTLVDRIGTAVNGLVKYTVKVLLDPTDAPVLFGATANVVLTTSEPHTMLAVPISAIQSDADGEYVLRINADGSTEKIMVESGDLSESVVTVTTSGNLKEGDKVQLGTTSSSTSSSNNRNNGGGFDGPGIMPGGPGGM